MPEATPPGGRGRGYLDEERRRIDHLERLVGSLEAEIGALKARLGAPDESATMAGLLATAQFLNNLSGSIDGLTNIIAGSMEQLVDGIGPLQSLNALVPEQTWKALAAPEAALLGGLSSALVRPDFGSRQGLETVPEPAWERIFEHGTEAAG